MATAIGTNVVTAIARHYILPRITDNIYGSNPVFFRLNAANKKMVRGGTQIEFPLMYKRFTAGGNYSGAEVLAVTPQDTVKNGALDWAQYYVPVSVDGLTLIKTDSPDAIANFISMYFAQAEMEMAENLATGLWNDGSTSTAIIGLKGVVDDGSVLATYAGLLRSANTWFKGQLDSSTSTLTLLALQSAFGNASVGGRHPSLIASRQEQYNRYWNLNVGYQQYNLGPQGFDEQLANAGFTNMLFNGVPWVVDSHVFDGPNTSNSSIVMLNEDYFSLAVSPRADFYMEEFQTPINQDAMVAKLLWAGQLVCTNPNRNIKLTNLSA